MADWTTPADLRAQLHKRWERGELLADMAAGTVPDIVAPAALFPLRLSLRGPQSSELSDRFDDARHWASQLQQGAGAGYRLVLREWRHRIVGQNSLPDQAWVDTREDALRWIGKTREARIFQRMLDDTRAREPALLPWLAQQPMRALALADDWPRLLDLVAWIQAHPRPAVYLRQVDLPGIHSKFIEAQRGVLTELLDRVLPPEAIDAGATGAAQFARRYGFRDKPLRLRFRFLDPCHPGWAPGADQDYAVRHEAFAALDPAVSRVFITENEINFLAFPPAADSLLVFGAGYGFDALAQARWLARCELHYWGDIDTHGFAILDQLRSHLPHAQSFLMDRQTLLAHLPQWTSEPQPTLRDLPRLNDEERRLFDELRWLRLHDTPVRLEQERIGFAAVEQALHQTLVPRHATLQTHRQSSP
ncbi:DUF3322 domain-containing protein [Aquabacterium sp.]|uniref:DUF3322 domain-containing protein n=1 Tax=Aquabacterium sp. TaxID=1872578 RepID=UPI002CE8BAD5|nr:Wadjet anti-phage system protein JetD domain-containing protein [Aquabacterium sp.]HSW09180.1 Wadjet anti-phage system protein JetD domain-containing protein [Aquabacterium sp.]